MCPLRPLTPSRLPFVVDRWEERWADTRIHGTTKRQVAVMFAEEKPSLRELPLEPFRYYRYGERTMNLDGCIEVEAAYYGAPPGWLGRRVHAQWDELHVRILHPRTGQLLREHLRTRRGFHRIQEQDLPTRTPLSTEALLRRAHSAGAHVGALCEHIHRTEGELGVRRILGVLAGQAARPRGRRPRRADRSGSRRADLPLRPHLPPAASSTAFFLILWAAPLLIPSADRA